MTVPAPADEAEEASPARPFISAVELDGTAGLGGLVRLEMGRDRTVLVGRNGAGKSALLAGIRDCADEATWPAPYPRRGGTTQPQRFRCEITRPNAPGLTYEFVRRTTVSDDESLPPGGEAGPKPDVSWFERCWPTGGGPDLWRVEAGLLHLGASSEPPIALQSGLGLLALFPRGDLTSSPPPPEDVRALWLLLGRVSFVPAGVPRNEPSQRSEILLTSIFTKGGRRRWRMAPVRSGRVARVAELLANMHETQDETFTEFVTLARRLGVASEIHVRTYDDPRGTVPAQERRDVAMVDFDDTNIGLLSDGTLRVAEILADLLRPGGSVLLIEEPETAVHPGLLARVLNLLDSYVFDRQIVISTHSPDVVNWCDAPDLRLVSRDGGVTSTRRLTTAEADRVSAYLCDEGTLGEFIFTRTP